MEMECYRLPLMACIQYTQNDVARTQHYTVSLVVILSDVGEQIYNHIILCSVRGQKYNRVSPSLHVLRRHTMTLANYN